LAEEEAIGLATAHKAVREKFQLFPCKVTAVQELTQADHEKRIRCCEWFKNFIQTKTIDTLDVIFFIDETCFHLSGYVNTTGVPRGVWGFNPTPTPKLFRSFDKAEPNSQFREKYILRT
jgi:hypothetical protein